jgi:hypothetical protein
MIAVSTFHIMMNTISKQVNDNNIQKLGLPTKWQGRNEWADCSIELKSQWTHMLFLLTEATEQENNGEIDQYIDTLWSLILDFD